MIPLGRGKATADASSESEDEHEPPDAHDAPPLPRVEAAVQRRGVLQPRGLEEVMADAVDDLPEHEMHAENRAPPCSLHGLRPEGKADGKNQPAAADGGMFSSSHKVWPPVQLTVCQLQFCLTRRPIQLAWPDSRAGSIHAHSISCIIPISITPVSTSPHLLCWWPSPDISIP